MSGFARNNVFFWVTGDSVAEKSRLACATGAAILALPSIPVRFARAVELKVPGDFFSSLWMLCYCVSHVLKYFVHSNCCIKAMCSTVVCCNSIVLRNSCATQSVQIPVEWLRQRFSKGTCSAVLSCDSDCLLQVTVGRSHWNCYIMDAI